MRSERERERERDAKSFLIILFGVFLVLFSGEGVSATDYYINATTGSDASDGLTPGTAWKTISKVNGESFNPGDNIYFARGEIWREQLTVPSSGNSTDQITFGAYGVGEKPIISGADVEATWTASGQGNIYQKDVGYTGGVILEDGVPLTFLIWDTDLATTFSGASAGSYSQDTGGTTAYVWSTDDADPDTHTIQVAKRDYCIYSVSKDYITIDGFIIEGASKHGIFLHYNNDYWTIQNNTIRNLGGEWVSSYYLGNGIDIHSNTANHIVYSNTIYNIFDSAITPQSSDNSETISTVTISNNTIYNCGYAGVEVSVWSDSTSMSGITIANNTIYDSGKGWSGDRNAYGIVVECGAAHTGSTITSTSIHGNKIYSNVGEGIKLGEVKGTVTVYQNAIYDNTLKGIMVEDGDNPTATGIIAYYNFIYGNTADGFFYNVPDDTNGGVTLYGNVFYGNGAGNARIYQKGSGTELIKNNIFFGVGTYAFYDDNGIAAGSEQDYNLHYRLTGNIIYYSGTGYDSTEWATYKSASSQDTNSPTPTNPLFLNTSGYMNTSTDFQLQWNSSSIDAGTDVNLTTDYTGNSIYGTPDIGAYEYQPPHTIGTNKIDITGNIRIYGDGKFRYTTANSSTATANLTIEPVDSFNSTNYSEWLNINISFWNTDGNYSKNWTEDGSISENVSHAVSDLKANTYFTVKVDNVVGANITGASCTNGLCLSDTSGKITFNYTGGYSSHVFEVVDATAPTITFSCSPTSVRTGGGITCSCSATDGVDSSPTVSYTANPLTSSTGTFTTTCTATDDVGNSASSEITYTVSPSGDSAIGGGSSSSSTWSNTYIVNDEQFSQGYSKELSSKERMKVSVGSQTHYVGVKSLTETSATIEIASEPITLILEIGDDAKVDLDSNGFYDLYVKLNNIVNNKADLSVKEINEKVPDEIEDNIETSGKIVSEGEIIEENVENKNSWIYFLIGFIFVLVLVVGITIKVKKKK